MDLISFKFFGNLDANPYLLDNDVIFVPLRERVVQIVGTVRRPGTYELKNEKTIQDLVNLAGGFTSGVANPAPLKVIRFDHGEKEVIDVENTEAPRRAFTLQNADVIFVPHVFTEKTKFDYNIPVLPGDNQLFYPSFEERVFVIGAVAKPGPYPFSPYYDVKQYLTIAGGTTKLAKVRKIKILGSGGKKIRAVYSSPVSPGDSIVVPEKYMAPENMLTLFLTSASVVLGITTSILTLK